MNKFSGISLFMFLFMLFGCEKKVERTYIIENSSPHGITIEFYLNKTLQRTVELLENETWEQYYEKDMASGVEPYQVYGADSLYVLYDNAKSQSYSLSDENDRNLLFNHPYSVEKKGIYRYTFTIEDHENANDLEDSED